MEYNKKHGITPTTISKAIHDILIRKRVTCGKKTEMVNVDMLKNSYNLLIPKQKRELLKKLEAKMLEHAKNLEFEEAAVVRDEIQKIRRSELK